jgi:enediyne biosynthesis protein E4
MRCLFAVILFVLGSCASRQERNKNSLFTRLTREATGVLFENKLDEFPDFDVFRYRNFYNGGGVAIGDINNDGLPDLYFTANSRKDKLYLNLGNFRFKDITASAGVGGSRRWSTGVCMADVNGDGFLDIYVCNAGNVAGDQRGNELFINNGNLTFTEKAAEIGLADGGYSTHAAFFDYDLDGDLDCYVLNNSFQSTATLGLENRRTKRDSLGGHRLYENRGGKFVDVSEHAGIYGSLIGLGLGIIVGDVNQDGWPDIYVSNDLFERDYLYINQHDGTFLESLPEYLGHVSAFSMGGDMADLDNDGLLDIFSTDMLPEDDQRVKTVSAFDTYEQYEVKVKSGYYYQYMRNMLQRNNGDGTFSEIGQMAGVSATDWSWGALLADFDNDRRREIFVSNGIYKDVTNQDFIEFMADDETVKGAMMGKKMDFKKFVNRLPSTPLQNYMFRQDSGVHYKNVAWDWGFDEPSFSNGAAYGDLDNDGDLDLVINNVNQEAFIYRNNSEKNNKKHFLKIQFSGSGLNRFGYGAKVAAYRGTEVVFSEQMPIRGFQSSMDPNMLLGLGDWVFLDSLTITWPGSKRQTLNNLPADQRLLVRESDAKKIMLIQKPMPKPLLAIKGNLVGYQHHENGFNDFNHERLLYHMLSTQGPAVAVGDLNADGLDDLFIGGAKGQVSAVFIQDNAGGFERMNTRVFDPDSVSETVDAIFFDADGDKDLDLYLVTGGSEFAINAIELQDHLYINIGTSVKPEFYRSFNKIPDFRQNGSCVRAFDWDGDHDLDLFVGTRAKPGAYGEAAPQFMFRNDGHGIFTDVTKEVAPEFLSLGMVTDACWGDIDGNGFADLLIVGDWMRPQFFLNDGQRFSKWNEVHGLHGMEGWWNSVAAEDLDNDGDVDFVLGNVGWNSKFKATEQHPISLYLNDFDQNGSVDPIFTYEHDGKDIPISLKQDMARQIPSVNKKFIYNEDYAGKTIGEVFGEEACRNSRILRLTNTSTSVLINKGKGEFKAEPLSWQAQTSPVYAIQLDDMNQDGLPDILLGGNLFAVKPEVGRYDAMHGLVLLGAGNMKFRPQTSQQSGLLVKGETRKIRKIKSANGDFIGIFLNNQSPVFYKLPTSLRPSL